MNLQRLKILVFVGLIACGGAESGVERGNAALSAGDATTAVAEFTAALEVAPGRADAWFGRGKANLALKDEPTALSDLRKAVAIEPTLLDAWRILAEREPEATARLAAIEQVVTLAPDDLDARKDRAVLWTETGRSADAITELEAWLAQHAEDKEVWGLYGDALLAADRPYDAYEAYQNGTNKSSREPRAFAAIKRRARSGDVEAMTFLRRKNEPVELYVEQAQALYEAGRMQAALEAGRKALAVNVEPNRERALSLALTAAAHAGLLVDETFIATRGGSSAMERERAFKEIVENCEESIAIEPTALAWRTAGFARLQLDQDARALDSFTNAVILDPTDLKAHRWRAEAAEAKGRYDIVVEDVDAIEKLGKIEVEDLLLRARARGATPGEEAHAKADLDRAVAIAEAAGKASSGLYPSLKARGMYFAAQGNPEAAKADLTRARALRPIRDEELEAMLASLGGSLR